MTQLLAKNRYKYLVLAVLFLGWLVGNVDRMVTNIAVIPIADEFSLSPTAKGAILSSFFAGYALMQIPGGWLTDKFGSRRVLIIAIVVLSLFTGLTGAAWSFLSLIIIRFLFGLGEASFPTASVVTISEHFPSEQRARALSAFLSASLIGAAVTPILASSMIVWVGWRSLFFIIALIGLLIAVLCWFFIKPPTRATQMAGEHPEQTKANKVPLKMLLKMPLLWSLLATSFGIYFLNWGLATWMPTYLVKERHLDLMSMGVLSSIPAFAGFVSVLLGGWIFDRWMVGREKYFTAFSAACVAGLLYLMFNAPSAGLVIAYQTLIMVFGMFVTIAVAAQPLKRFPKEVIGTASGIVNFGGQAAGFVAPMLIGMTVDAFGSYEAASWLLIFAVCVSMVAALTMPGGEERGRLLHTVDSDGS